MSPEHAGSVGKTQIGRRRGSGCINKPTILGLALATCALVAILLMVQWKEWVELETCAFVFLRETRYSGSTRRGQSSYRPSRVYSCILNMFHGTEFGAF
eukprot:COSAG02_NODE_7064_length_3201_cov_43.745003_2_plen_99_part_00